MSQVRLFVYGSLKRGFVHHEKLAGASFVYEVQTAPGYSLYLYQGYPALVKDGAGVVSGELFYVTSGMLPALDTFEDVPDLYQRAELVTSDGGSAFAYLMSREKVSDCPCMSSGQWTLDWQARVLRRL